MRSPRSTRSELARRSRLDVELVRRGLAPSREQAATLIDGGRVRIDGAMAVKAATGVAPHSELRVLAATGPTYASRGGHKLAGALESFAVAVEGRRALDAGASTGGFTDVLLQRGAREVVAVDVGYGQLAWALRTDERVRVLDRTNVRSLTADDLGGPVDLVVADLSFIPLRLVLPALAACAAPGGDLLPMVKPQFEVGRERLPSGGVVRDPELRTQAVLAVAEQAVARGLVLRGVTASPLPGPSGNVEYFLWLRADPGDAQALDPQQREAAVSAAVHDGPA